MKSKFTNNLGATDLFKNQLKINLNLTINYKLNTFRVAETNNNEGKFFF